MRNEGKSICNCCGRVLEQEEYINIEKQWGYFSKKDTKMHSFVLCEECYDKMISRFVIPPIVTDVVEL